MLNYGKKPAMDLNISSNEMISYELINSIGEKISKEKDINWLYSDFKNSRSFL